MNSVNEAFLDNANKDADIVQWMTSKGLQTDAILTLKELSQFHKDNLSMIDADHLIEAALLAAGMLLCCVLRLRLTESIM